MSPCHVLPCNYFYSSLDDGYKVLLTCMQADEDYVKRRFRSTPFPH